MTYRVALFALAFVGGGATVQVQERQIDGVRVVDEEFDAAGGSVRFTIRNDARADLVAWVYTITLHRASGRTAQQYVVDESILHAFLTSPSIANRPVSTGASFISPGGTRAFFHLVQPPPEVAPAKLEQVSSASVSLTAAVFGDGRGMGDPGGIRRIEETRKRQAGDALVALNALRTSASMESPDAASQLRLATRALSAGAADMVRRAADAIEKQPDPTARERLMTTLAQMYEVQYAALVRPIVVQ